MQTRTLDEDVFMSKIAWTVTGICPGGNHLTVLASLNGAPPTTLILDVNDIATISEEEFPIIVKYLVRCYSEGKTTAQVKSGGQLGVTVNM